MKKEKVVFVRVDQKTHHEIKRLALFKYLSMEDWAVQALIEKLERDKSYMKDNEIP